MLSSGVRGHRMGGLEEDCTILTLSSAVVSDSYIYAIQV